MKTGATLRSQPPLVEEVVAAVRQVVGAQPGTMSLHEPEFAGREWVYVKECLDTGWVSSVGEYVSRFERDLSAVTGIPHVVATSNGTSALHMCLLLAGVRAGHEVLVPTLTFVATANAIVHAGATPHFVDCETVSLGVDAAWLEAWLREVATVEGGACINRRTGAQIKALVPVHIFGHPCDIEALDAVARRWNLVLIEDAAEALGSYQRGQHAGRTGLLSALSFNGNKIVTTGGGGAIMTSDKALGQRARHLTTTARVAHRWEFTHDEVGYNYRMPNLNAALGCAQLERLPLMVERKRRLAARYKAALQGIEGVAFLDEPAGTASNYWLNTIVLDPADALLRDPLLAALNEAGFGSRPVWDLMHRLPMYQECPRAGLPVAEDLAARVINLPSSARLGD